MSEYHFHKKLLTIAPCNNLRKNFVVESVNYMTKIPLNFLCVLLKLVLHAFTDH